MKKKIVASAGQNTENGAAITDSAIFSSYLFLYFLFPSFSSQLFPYTSYSLFFLLVIDRVRMIIAARLERLPKVEAHCCCFRPATLVHIWFLIADRARAKGYCPMSIVKYISCQAFS